MERRISLSHSYQPGNGAFHAAIQTPEIILFRFLDFEYNHDSLSKSNKLALQKRFSMDSVEGVIDFDPDRKRK